MVFPHLTTVFSKKIVKRLHSHNPKPKNPHTPNDALLAYNEIQEPIKWKEKKSDLLPGGNMVERNEKCGINNNLRFN